MACNFYGLLMEAESVLGYSSSSILWNPCSVAGIVEDSFITKPKKLYRLLASGESTISVGKSIVFVANKVP